jgi:hypothetical protein
MLSRPSHTRPLLVLIFLLGFFGSFKLESRLLVLTVGSPIIWRVREALFWKVADKVFSVKFIFISPISTVSEEFDFELCAYTIGS